jgi:hypothetical protein
VFGGFEDRWKPSSERSMVEGHIRFHVLDPKSAKNAPQVEAAEELIDVVRTYLK